MEKETAIELLKIAAQLTTAALETNTDTEKTHTTRKRAVEGVFEDCLVAVEAHFGDLIGTSK